MNRDELAARRLAKAEARVDADCERSIAVIRSAVPLSDLAAQIAASRWRHPSNPVAPYDHERET